jgi:O-succinylbenzoic acid--CoA ligase
MFSNRLDWLSAQARASPEKIALTFGDQFWTYHELDAEVNALCLRLRSLLLARGDIVATHLPNHPLHVMLVHALTRLGLVMAPLNTRLTFEELVAQLAHLQPACLICNDEQTARMLSTSANILLTAAQLSELSSLASSEHDFNFGEGIQSIVFTSGSSGLPKAVELTREQHFYNAVASSFRLGVQNDDCWLCCLPIYHVGGMALVFRACLYGITLALHERFDLEAIHRVFDAPNNIQPITLISLVPTMLKRLLETRKKFPASLRLILLGGAAASEALLTEAFHRGLPVAPTYGMTETASQIATQMPQVAKRKPGSVGKPLLFMQCRITDDLGNSLPTGEIGEVVVSGPCVTRGYFRNPTETNRVLRHNEFFTGDLGYLDPEGDLWLVLRRSDLIVSGGENIFPAEVENVLRSHPDVAEAIVLGIPDEEWGQTVAALVISKTEQLDLQNVLMYARTRLARYKLPRTIRVVQQLPLLANGKIDRAAAQLLLCPPSP